MRLTKEEVEGLLRAHSARKPKSSSSNTTDNATRGRLSRTHGERFEQVINASLEAYRAKGYAVVEKTPEPMRPLNKPNTKGQFLACFVSMAQPDYQGTLAGGRSVVFEAKYSASDRINKNRLTPAQADRLAQHAALGAICFVLVGFQGDCFRIPWQVWAQMESMFGHKHIKRVEAEPYRIPEHNGFLQIFHGL